ncbi:MAG: shikimate kinase [Halobacteriales archaeon]|nr:shikimate kinase [Halobacteriales archaeon]
MQGRAEAPAAGTVLNALANGRGSAFAIDRYVEARVELDPDGPVRGAVAGEPDADTSLIERCVELVVEAHGEDEGGRVRTESEVPMASGLKSSSAAANAAVLATLDALDVPVSDAPGAEGVTREDAAWMGVRAAREVGVTITGAFDDATASMLGGVTVTDNGTDTLLSREPVHWDVLVWTPPERAYSADADVERCERLAPVADFVAETLIGGRYAQAMTVNGLAFCAALGFPTEPLLEALPEAWGVSLSGTGPSVTAIGQADALVHVQDRWDEREGTTWLTTTQNDGARTI